MKKKTKLTEFCNRTVKTRAPAQDWVLLKNFVGHFFCIHIFDIHDYTMNVQLGKKCQCVFCKKNTLFKKNKYGKLHSSLALK